MNPPSFRSFVSLVRLLVQARAESNRAVYPRDARYVETLMARPTRPERFLTAAEAEAVRAAIAEAERVTSAELKVVLARHCWGDLKRKARRIFRDLGLDRTQGRNCALILLILANREFLVYGDEGIHTKVGQDFWDDVRREMQESFGRDAFGEGIAAGVRRVGEKLAQHFPCQRNDVDEISNEIVYRT